MKIAILTPTFHPFSGIDRVAQLQAEQLSEEGHEVTVIALESSLKPQGYEVMALGMPKSQTAQRLYRLFFFLDRKKLNAYRVLKGFDKVIAHFYPMTWLAHEAKKYYDIKYVYWDHGVNTTGLLDSIPQKIYMSLFRFFNNHTIKTADEAYSVSKYLSEELWKESRIKSKVAYNEIDKKRFNPQAKPGAVKKTHGLEGKKVVLYVGRIALHKGVHYLIDAMKRVQQKVPDAALLIVGKETFPGYANELKAMVKRKEVKNIIFAGFVKDNDLPSYYASCDLYATGSQWEGYDLPAAEAQAVGKSVVAFDVGSHKEIVKKGVLIKNRNIQAFADAIVSLLSKKNKK